MLNTRKFLLVVLLLATAVLSTGCGKALAPELVGKWKARLPDKLANSSKPEDQMTKAMAEGMLSMFTLELKADKTFSMTMMMFPIEGTWSLSGYTLELKATKVMGMSSDQLKSQSKGATSGPDAQDWRFTVSPDGKQLTPIEDGSKAKKENMEMVFVKE